MNTTPDTAAAITCQDSVRFVSLLRDRELSATDLTRLERHVQTCPRCQTARQQFEILHTELDALLARPVQADAKQAQPMARPLLTGQAPAGRRQWLAWLTGTGIGALAGTGATVWRTAPALQAAQTPDEVLARRMAQYQALYVRDTVQDVTLSADQLQAALAQWSQHAPNALRIQAAPALEKFGLRLVRAQRLALNDQPILQWVYLPERGHPVALCIMANRGQAPSPPQFFLESGMRGVHWHGANAFGVLLAPYAVWPSKRMVELQKNIALQLAGA